MVGRTEQSSLPSCRSSVFAALTVISGCCFDSGGGNALRNMPFASFAAHCNDIEFELYTVQMTDVALEVVRPKSNTHASALRT